MPRIVQVIGNGDCAVYYNEEPKRKGLKLTCNVSPFAVEGVYATCIVDFKMMNTIHKGGVTIPGEWICGARPKEYCSRNPKFHLQIANHFLQNQHLLPTTQIEYQQTYLDHLIAFCKSLLFPQKM